MTHERATRAIALCRTLAAITEEPGRTTRRFLTEPMQAAHKLLRERMEVIGLRTEIDAAGNLHGIWNGGTPDKKPLLIGSHIDTVPNAGAFDGVLGVALAIELAALVVEKKIPLNLRIVAFSEEEGVRFNKPFLGSAAVAGCFKTEWLTLRDCEGITLAECIRNFGLNPDEISMASLADEISGYFELHIEQGPVLEAEDHSLGVVTAIIGQTRGSLTFTGRANHAGTTPMSLRYDAMTAAAEWIIAIEEFALASEGLVATTGSITATPNVGNVIACAVELSLDLRSADDEQRGLSVANLIARAEQIAERRGLTVEWQQTLDQAAVPMDSQLTQLLCDAVAVAGLTQRKLPSGAGHDAMILARIAPAAMLFLRSPGGISHHPDESVLVSDVSDAINAGFEFLQAFAKGIE